MEEPREDQPNCSPGIGFLAEPGATKTKHNSPVPQKMHKIVFERHSTRAKKAVSWPVATFKGRNVFVIVVFYYICSTCRKQKNKTISEKR